MHADRQRPSWVGPSLVVAVAVLTYANALGNGFALDDVRIVRDNPHLLSLTDAPSLFSGPYWPHAGGEASGLYRPVTLLTFALDRALFRGSPAGSHAVNVVLHALVSVLALYAFRRAARYFGTALPAALLFAVHPIHVEVVASLVGRSELLAGAGVLAAWLAYRRGAEAPSVTQCTAWSAAAAGFYGIAVLSKETAILAPLVFLADDIHRRRHAEWGALTLRTARAWIMLTFVAVATLGMRVLALGGLHGAGDALTLDNPVVGAPFFTRVATALWVQTKYFGLMLWPARLSSDYSLDAIPAVHSALDPRYVAGLAFAVAFVSLTAYGWLRSRPMFLGAVLWCVFFLPSSNLLFPVGVLMAERLAYLPSLGFCLGIGHLAAWAAGHAGTSRRLRRRAVLAALAVVLLLLGIRTWLRSPVWKDNASLALHDVEVMPRSAKLQAGAGIALAEAGRYAEAERHFRAALAIYPDYAQVHYNLGVLLVGRGQRSEAVEHLTRSAALSPRNPRPRELLSRMRDDATLPAELRLLIDEAIGEPND